MKTNVISILSLAIIVLCQPLAMAQSKGDSNFQAFPRSLRDDTKTERIFLAIPGWEIMVWPDGKASIELMGPARELISNDPTLSIPILFPPATIDYGNLKEILTDRLKHPLKHIDKYIIQKVAVCFRKSGDMTIVYNQFVDYNVWNNLLDDLVGKLDTSSQEWLFWKRMKTGRIKIEPVDYIGESREIHIVPLTQDTLLMQWIIGWRIYFFKDGSISVRRRLAEPKEIEVAAAPAKSVDDEWIKYRLVSAWNSGFAWEKQYGQRHE